MSNEDDYDLQAVVDDGNVGPEPSQEYMKRLDLLDNVVRECISVSKNYAGIASPTARHFYASVIFTVLITRGVSLLDLAPHTPWAEKKIEHWDYASLAGIVRTMIEKAFSKLKALLRKAAERTLDDLWDRIGALLPAFTPTECANFFAAAGYEPD